MKIVNNPTKQEWPSLCQRPQIELDFLESTVKNVLVRVKNSGDQALKEITAQFDKVNLIEIEVSVSEIENAIKTVPENLKEAIQTAARNIEKFHIAQKREVTPIETMPGVTCWRKGVPIEKVGIYIPGGSAPRSMIWELKTHEKSHIWIMSIALETSIGLNGEHNTKKFLTVRQTQV